MAERSKSGYLPLQVIFVIVVLFTVVASAGAVAVSADSIDVDREIDQNEISPGETTNVTLQITASNDDPAILEEFNGSVGNVSIQETTPEPVAKGVGDGNSGVTAVWEDTTNASIVYEVAAPANASDGDTIEITGEAGQSVIEIQEDDGEEESFFSIEISDTSSPIEAGEELEVTAQIENEGDVSDTQTIDFDVPGLGSDSVSVSLDGGDSQTETFSIPTSDGDAGDYTAEVESDDDSATTPVTVQSDSFFAIAITDTNSPIEENETLELTADIENEGDVSDTQTIDFDVPGLGSDSVSVSLDGGDSQTETFSIPTSDGDAGDYTAEVESDNDSDATPVSVDEVESPGGGAGGGGGGGGVGGGDDPELSVDIFDFEGSTTIRLGDIPRASEADIDTEAAIVGDAFTVSSIWMDFQFSPDDFRIEASDPRGDAGGAPSLASDMAEPLGYVELEFIGADESTITDTRIGVQVDDEDLSDSESREDLQVYQYIEGDWTPLETELDGETAMATVESISEEQFALGVETPEQTDAEDEQEDEPEETDDEAEDDAGDEAEDDAGGEVDDDTSEEVEEVEDDIPGFGVPIAILALIATTLIVVRRQLTSVFVTS